MGILHEGEWALVGHEGEWASVGHEGGRGAGEGRG